MDYILIKMDRERKLRFGLAALTLIEKKFDCKISKLQDTNDMGMEDLAMILYCGLKKDDPNLTEERCAELLDEYFSVPEISKLMNDAFEAAYGKQVNEVETKNFLAKKQSK